MGVTKIKKRQIENLQIEDADVASEAAIATTKLADGDEFLKRDGSVAYTGAQDFGGNTPINLGTPVNPTDAARLVDIQNFQAGLTAKEAVKVATTANITLSGTQTIDGVSIIAGDRVLVKNQTTASQNGIYVCAAAAWARSADADTSMEIKPSTFVFVSEGTINADSAWMLTTDAPIELNTTALTWVQFSGAGQITATAGITKTGNTLTTDLGYLDTKYPSLTASRTQNSVLAGPLSGSGVASFRTLGAADIPALAISGITGLQTALDAKHYGAGTSGYLPKYTGALTMANSLIFDNGTGVGVGTSNPTHAKFVVDANVAAPVAALSITNFAGGPGHTTGIVFGRGHYGFMDYDPQSSSGVRYSALGPIRFGSNTNAEYGSSTFVEALRITAAGNVGIGIITPAYKLDVSGTGRFTSDVTFGGNAILATAPTTGNHLTNKTYIDGKTWAISTVTGLQTALDAKLGGSGTNGYLSKYTGGMTLAASGVFESGGALGIGATALTGYNLFINRDLTGFQYPSGILSSGTILSDVGQAAMYYSTHANTQAAAFTLNYLFHFRAVQGTIGAGSTVATQVGFGVHSNLTGADTNIAFLSDIASGTGRWNLYMNGTANNYLAGNLWIGTVSSIYKLDVYGNGRFTGDVTFGSNAILATAPTNASHLTNKSYVDGKTWAISGITGLQTALDAKLSGSGTNGYLSKYTGALTMAASGVFESGGALGLGTTNLAARSIGIGRNITGSTVGFGIMNGGQIQSDVTSSVDYYRTAASTQAASFTLSSLVHYSASQGVFGAGSTVASQIGFSAGNMSDATANYGFYGNLSEGAGKYNLYMNGTANNYLAGALGIGTTNLAARSIAVSRNITGATAGYGILNNGQTQSDVTVSVEYFRTSAATQAATFTLGSLIHYSARQGTFGAGSTVNTQIGYYAADMIGGVSNYALYSDMSAGTGRWNLYMNGTANNYLAGALGIGTTIVSGRKLVIGGSITGATTMDGVAVVGTVQSDVTSAHRAFMSQPSFASGTATNVLHHFSANNASVSGTLANQIGISIGALNTATNNYAIYSGVVASATNWNLYIPGTANNYMAGSLGIGTTAISNMSLGVSRNITGGSSAYGIVSDGQIQSDVINSGVYFVSAAKFNGTTISSLSHFSATQGVFSGTVTNQIGFGASAGLIGGTRNYGFYGDIPAGTDRWNLYMNGTANNYMTGALGIGTTTLAARNLSISRNITGATAAYAVLNNGQTMSDVVSSVDYFRTVASTQAASFNLSVLLHYVASQGTFGEGSSVATQTGFQVNSTLIGATNNYGFRSQIPIGPSRFNLYMDGTANNYMAGTLGIGSANPHSNANLHLMKGSAGTYTLASSYNQMVIESNGNQAGVTMVSPDSGSAGLRWNSPSSGQFGYAYISSGGYNAGDLTIATNQASGFLSFRTGFNAERMLITSTGMVGIGTATPGLKTHITGALGFPATSGTAQTGVLRLQGNGSNGVLDFSVNGASGASLQVSNQISLSNNYPLLLNPNGGNVGIGTTTPSSRLVISDTTYNQFRIQNENQSIFIRTGFKSDGTAIPVAEERNVMFQATGFSPGSFSFSNGNNENMRIATSGNVGIGTTSPAYKLDVNGTGRFTGNVLLGGEVDITGKLKLGGSVGANKQVIKSDGTNTAWASLSTSDLSDNSNILMLGDYEGERGFMMYSNSAKDFTQGFVFSNPDTGTALALHAYGLDSANNRKEFGLLMDTDGLLYHQKLDGQRSQIATVDMLGSGGGGGSITYTGSSPISVVGNQISIQTANAFQGGALSANDWSSFNNKLSDGFSSTSIVSFSRQVRIQDTYSSGTRINSGVLSFGERHDGGAFSEYVSVKLIGDGGQKTLALIASPVAKILFNTLAGDISMDSYSGNINLNTSFGKVYIKNKEIDFSGFATGKVLKATSSTKAEWVNP